MSGYIATDPAKERPTIQIDGDVLVLRSDFAAEIHVHDRTAKRMNLPTTYIGGRAYVARNQSLRLIASRVRRREEPKRRHSIEK